MGLFRAISFLYTWIRFGIRWFSLISIVTLIIYVGLPFSASQDEMITTSIAATSQLTVVWNNAAALFNRYYDCTQPIRVVRNRIVSYFYGTFQIIAADVGIDISVTNIFRNAPADGKPFTMRGVLPGVDNYCDLVEDFGSFVVDLLDIISTPIYLIIDLVIDFSDPITLLEAIQEILQDLFLDAIDIGGCSRELPWSMYSCMCQRWDSPDEVPRDVFKASLACVVHSYDPDTDSFFDAIDEILGVPILRFAYNQFDQAVANLWQVWLYVVSYFNQTSAYIYRLAGDIGGLAGDIEALASDALDFFEDILDDIGDLFDRDVQFHRELDDLIMQARSIHLNSTRQWNDIQAVQPPMYGTFLRESLARLRDPLEWFVNRTQNHEMRRPAVKSLPNLAQTRALAEKIAVQKHPSVRGRALSLAVRNFFEVVWSNRSWTASEVADYHRESGLRATDLIQARDTCTDCRARRERATGEQPRFTPIPRPPDVTLSGKILITIAGALMLVTVVFVLSVLFPPAMLAFFFVTSSSIILIVMAAMTNQTLGAIDALQNRDINRLAYIPTLIAAAQFIGQGYFEEGLNFFNPVDAIDALLPHLAADLWYSSSVPVTLVVESLPLDIKMPVQYRGDTLYDIFVGALLCEQNATCTDVRDCRGRATDCVDGGCMCFGYVREKREVPILIVEDDTGLRCSDFGYHYDDMLPYQTGGFGWTNIWSTFRSFCAGMRDLAQHAINRDVLPAEGLVVYLFLFVPFLAANAIALGRNVVVILFLQELMLWSLRTLKVFGFNHLPYLSELYKTPDHGLTCVVFNLPAILLWIVILSALIAASTYIYVFLRWILPIPWWIFKNVCCVGENMAMKYVKQQQEFEYQAILVGE